MERISLLQRSWSGLSCCGAAGGTVMTLVSLEPNKVVVKLSMRAGESCDMAAGSGETECALCAGETPIGGLNTPEGR